MYDTVKGVVRLMVKKVNIKKSDSINYDFVENEWGEVLRKLAKK